MLNEMATYFKVSNKYIPINRKIQNILHKYLSGIFISSCDGSVLYSKAFNNNIKFDLISNFLSAISIFSEEDIGDIRRLAVEGAKLEMQVISKHKLHCVLLYKPEMIKDELVREMERGLDIFYEMFKEKLKNNLTNLTTFEAFDDTMAQIIHKYLIKIHAL